MLPAGLPPAARSRRPLKLLPARRWATSAISSPPPAPAASHRYLPKSATSTPTSSCFAPRIINSSTRTPAASPSTCSPPPKAAHEESIAAALDPSATRAEANRETIAGYVDHWADACDLDHWNGWTAGLFAPESPIAKDRLDALEALPRWMLARIWPSEAFSAIKAAMTNFRKVVTGFGKTYRLHAEPLPKRRGGTRLPH